MKNLIDNINNQVNETMTQQREINENLASETKKQIKTYSDNIIAMVAIMKIKETNFFKFEKIKKWIFITACVMQPVLVAILISKILFR